MIQTKLKQWRKSQGLSQKDLGKIVNVGSTIIGLYETDKSPFSMKTALKWSKDCKINYTQIYSQKEYVELMKKLRPEFFTSF